MSFLVKESKLQIRQNTLDEILNDVSNSRFDDSKLIEGKLKDYYSTQIRMINEFFSEKKYYHYIKKPDTKMILDLSKNCKKKMKRPELHNQIAFAENTMKLAHVPRDLLISCLEEDSTLVKNMKKYSNRMEALLTRVDKSLVEIDLFSAASGGQIERSKVGIREHAVTGGNCKFEIEPMDKSEKMKLSKQLPRILQIKKHETEDPSIILFLRGFTSICSISSKDVISLRESIFDMKKSAPFPSEIIEMKCSKYKDEPVTALCRNNKLVWLNPNLEPSKSVDTAVDAQLYSYDLTDDSNISYLQSIDKIYLFDRRINKGRSCLTSASDSKSPFSKFYAINNMRDQYFLTVNNRYVSFYDVRSPSHPILNTNHHMEFNPPEIIEFSNFEEEFLSDDWLMESFLENSALNQPFLQEKPKGLLSCFSANKHGLAIYFGIDKSFTFHEQGLSQQICQVLNHEKFHFMKLSQNLEPRLFYSSNIGCKTKKIIGHKVFTLGKNLNLAFQSDNHGGLYLQNLSQTAQTELGYVHTRIKSNINIKGDSNEEESLWKSQLGKYLKEKVPEKRKFSIVEESNLDDTGDSELEEYNKQFSSQEMQESAGELGEGEDDMKKIYLDLRGVLKDILKESYNSATGETIDLELKLKEEEIQTQNPAEQIGKMPEINDFENKIFNDDFQFIQPPNPEKAMPSYYNSGFIITKNLENRLKTLWDAN